ncbi:MAG: hypothetical protein SCH71_08625 [Desulfobulbaceae bacterium]|nr:hypothetical protein [Desulfobulbaceae bacterium]
MLNNRNGISAPPNKWFENRRDFFIRKVVDEFLSMYCGFQEVYAVYLRCRAPYLNGSDHLVIDSDGNMFRIWEQLTRMVGSESDKGPLWRLKDLCHLVWPEGTYDHDRSGSLVDWLIGSIFHEAMKLKENVYLLNRYGSAAYKMKEYSIDIPVTALSARAPTLENIVDVEGVINGAAADVVKQMEQIAFLFITSSYMLRMILPAYAGNAFIIRLLIEREALVERFWGESLEDIFNDMYCGDAAEGFCRAGRSYLSGQWFFKALVMYKRAIKVNPTCDEAITRMVQLQQIVSENKELLVGAA